MSIFDKIRERAINSSVYEQGESYPSLHEIIARIKKTGGRYLKSAEEEVVVGDDNQEDRLQCPPADCQADSNLHQEAVVCIWRDQEDGDGTLIASSSSQVIVERVGNREIPGRRDAMYVVFSCECDRSRKVLEIIQHKGGTYMNWRKDLVEDRCKTY